MRKRIFVFIIITIFCCLSIGIIFSLFFGSTINVSKTLSFLETLTTISSILLGVMGVWLSIIWKNNSNNKNENITYIKTSLFLSLTVIVIFLISKQSYPILIQIRLFMDPKIKKIIRIIIFFISIELTLLTILSVFTVVFSFDFFSFDNDINSKRLKSKMDKNVKIFGSIIKTKNNDEIDSINEELMEEDTNKD